MAIEVDEDEVKNGLLSLLVTLIEIIQEVLEKEAIRRMETGNLDEEEIERLGDSLYELSKSIEEIKNDHDLDETVEDLRGQLDDVVRNEVIDVVD